MEAQQKPQHWRECEENAIWCKCGRQRYIAQDAVQAVVMSLSAHPEGRTAIVRFGDECRQCGDVWECIQPQRLVMARSLADSQSLDGIGYSARLAVGDGMHMQTGARRFDAYPHQRFRWRRHGLPLGESCHEKTSAERDVEQNGISGRSRP